MIDESVNTGGDNGKPNASLWTFAVNRCGELSMISSQMIAKSESSRRENLASHSKEEKERVH